MKKHRRAAWAIGLSLVLHGLVLTSMVVGLKVLRPLPESRAVEVELVPAPELQSRPAPPLGPPERARNTPPLRPRPTPRPSPEAPVAAPPETPAPAPRVYGPLPEGPKGMAPSLSGRMGCDDVLGFHVNSAQRQACADNLAKLGREAKPFELDIPDDKKAEYDRHVRCNRDYTERPGIAPMTEYDADGNVKTGPSAGLGDIPRRCLGLH